MLGRNVGSDETWKRIPSDSVGIELGVWKGDSSAKFLLKSKLLHLVDPWSVLPYESSDEFGDYNGYLSRYKNMVGSTDPKDFQKFYDNIYTEVVNRFKNDSVVIHRCTTDEFFTTFNDTVDWVYVDALHNFEGCLNDLRNSLAVVKDGGFIFGDDYGNKPGVVAAVDQFIKETNLTLVIFAGTQYEIQVK